jgi:hypothetical protein
VFARTYIQQVTDQLANKPNRGHNYQLVGGQTSSMTSQLADMPTLPTAYNQVKASDLSRVFSRIRLYD